MTDMKRLEEAISLLGWLKRLPEFSRTQFVVFDWLISEVRRLRSLLAERDKEIERATRFLEDYGRHNMYCSAMKGAEYCDCGFEEGLAALKREAK